jgi:hypothetical protein
MKKIKNIINSVRLLWYGLFRGMKSADNVISTKASYGSSNSEINQQQEIDNVFNDLLKGEETQRVKEMRDEYYRTIHEASKIHVDIDGVDIETLANDFDNPNITLKATSRKKTALDFTCKIEVFNPENLHLKCIQDNVLVQTQNNFFAENFNEDDYVSVFRIKRGDFIPRFKIEDYANKLVVRVIDDKTSYLDFYVSIYASQFGFVADKHGKVKKDNSALLISELNRLLKKELRTSDVVELSEIVFDTDKAYGVPNPSHFEFDNIKYKSVNVHDGNFVITLKANNKVNYSAIEKYHTDELDKKLETHAVRDGKTVDINTIMRHEKQEELNKDKNTDE